jgi:hypothetical protein
VLWKGSKVCPAASQRRGSASGFTRAASRQPQRLHASGAVTAAGGPQVLLLAYGSAPHERLSDHKPVHAALALAPDRSPRPPSVVAISEMTLNRCGLLLRVTLPHPLEPLAIPLPSPLLNRPAQSPCASCYRATRGARRGPPLCRRAARALKRGAGRGARGRSSAVGGALAQASEVPARAASCGDGDGGGYTLEARARGDWPHEHLVHARPRPARPATSARGAGRCGAG